MVKPIDLKTPSIDAKINLGKVYMKSAETHLRLVREDGVGKDFRTFKKQKDGLIVLESSKFLVKGDVIARNPDCLGRVEGVDVYNEWPIDMPTVVKNYGDIKITDEFTGHKKKATIKAIELDKDLLDELSELGCVEGDKLFIKVSWDERPMEAHLGDYLTSGGYSIAKNNMKDYELVEELSVGKNPSTLFSQGASAQPTDKVHNKPSL